MKGRLGIVACPMLEDELIRSIRDDPEEKRVIVIDTDYCSSLKRKLTSNGVPFDTADEFDFMNGWLDIDSEAFNIIIIMNHLALHAEPKDLKDFIEDQLIGLQGRVDALGLYYGMCGNYGWDISKWAEEHISYRVAVFRDCKGRVIDDCIGVAVGGLDGYLKVLKTYTGMLLLTPAMATNWIDFLMAGEIGKGIGLIADTGDPKENMKRLLYMCGYNSAVKIDTGLEDEEEFDASVREIVEFLEFKLYHAPPEMVNPEPMHRMYDECKSLLSHIV